MKKLLAAIGMISGFALCSFGAGGELQILKKSLTGTVIAVTNVAQVGSARAYVNSILVATDVAITNQVFVDVISSSGTETNRFKAMPDPSTNFVAFLAEVEYPGFQIENGDIIRATCTQSAAYRLRVRQTYP